MPMRSSPAKSRTDRCEKPSHIASYLPWLAGTLEECPGEGYWLSFNQRLPISYELGDRLYGLLHHGRLVREEEDAEGEIAEDTVEEEIIY